MGAALPLARVARDRVKIVSGRLRPRRDQRPEAARTVSRWPAVGAAPAAAAEDDSSA
jgi:hypothetical protein